jgi:hypothetical protein
MEHSTYSLCTPDQITQLTLGILSEISLLSDKSTAGCSEQCRVDYPL